MTYVDVALFNFEDGGRLVDGTYDFTRLQRAFADVGTAPSLVLLCEAKNYKDHAGEAKYQAAEALSDELGVPYVVEIGSMARAPMPPAIFYDPRVLVLRHWWQQEDPGVYEDQKNYAWFAIRGSGRVAGDRTEFVAYVEHWEPLSGDVRLEAARRMSRASNLSLPVICGGDLNATASGKHLPQRDWMAAEFRSRSRKGMRGPDGQWGPDTRAVDYLIGTWDEDAQERRDGCGLHAVAEMAWRHDPGKPIVPTVNEGVDAGGGLLIDWLVVNEAMKPHVLPDTYQVHVPDPMASPPSDHRLVTVTLNL